MPQSLEAVSPSADATAEIEGRNEPFEPVFDATLRER